MSTYKCPECKRETTQPLAPPEVICFNWRRHKGRKFRVMQPVRNQVKS